MGEGKGGQEIICVPRGSAANQMSIAPRAAARPSALLLALVHRARVLWLGWFERRLHAFMGWRAARRARAATQASRGAPTSFRFETFEPKLLLSADLAPAALLAPLADPGQLVVERRIEDGLS
jgi:hypothetical protein